MEKFWMVWCPTAGVPTRRHGSESQALAEAGRLARTTNGEFFVLEAKSVSKRVDVRTVDLVEPTASDYPRRDPSDNPFKDE